MSTPSRILPAATIAATLAIATHAQEVVQLDKFEVTSQKRVEAIQEVPIPVTAFSGDFLKRAGASDFKSLAPFVPGFFVQEQSPNNPGINIRGITTDSGDPRSETRVSIFQDGVSISRSRGSVVELFDLERVEVLKGPQGTLFGRGAEIGALSIVQNKAANANTAEFSAGLGSYNEVRAGGYANAILAKDELFGRVAFAYRKHDGVVENIADGSDLNGKDTLGLRTALRWQPQAETTVDLILNYQHDNPPGTAFKSGTIAPTGGDTSPFTFAELNRGKDLYIDRTVWGATLLADHQLSPALSLSSVTGWREFDSMEQFDADGSRLNLLEFAEDAEGRQLSQELRLNYNNGGSLTGFIGASYFHEKGSQTVPFYADERALWPFLSGSFRSGLISAGIPSALANAAIPTLNPFVAQTNLPTTFSLFANSALPASIQGLALLAGAPLKATSVEQYINSAETDAYELFTDGTWRVTDRLSLTAGVRFSHEKNTSGYQVINAATPSNIGFILGGSPNVLFAPTNGLRQASGDQDSYVGRAVVAYKLANNLHSYVSASRGRRPESILITASTTTHLQEEVVWNYEAGLKGGLLNNRVQWSTSVFHYDYQHFQTTVADTTNLGRFTTVDAGNATGQGFEAAVQGAVSDHVSLFASYGYTDATFDETGDDGRRQQYAGYSFRLTARHTLSVGGTFVVPLGANGQIYVSPVYQYKSRHYFEDNNANFNYTLGQAGFPLVNLRAGWRSRTGRYEVTAYAENLLDRDYLIDAGNTGGSFGIPTFIAGTPLLAGLDATVRF